MSHPPISSSCSGSGTRTYVPDRASAGHGCPSRRFVSHLAGAGHTHGAVFPGISRRRALAWPLLRSECILIEESMQPSDLTVEILRGIRDEVRGLRVDVNERVDATNARLDALREDTNVRFERLERRQTETEVRLASEIVAVAGAVREGRGLFRENRVADHRIDDHERRVPPPRPRGAGLIAGLGAPP